MIRAHLEGRKLLARPGAQLKWNLRRNNANVTKVPYYAIQKMPFHPGLSDPSHI